MTWTWFVFTAVKDGEEITREIPWESWEAARAELLEMGLTDIKLLDSYTMRCERGRWYPV